MRLWFYRCNTRNTCVNARVRIWIHTRVHMRLKRNMRCKMMAISLHSHSCFLSLMHEFLGQGVGYFDQVRIELQSRIKVPQIIYGFLRALQVARLQCVK